MLIILYKITYYIKLSETKNSTGLLNKSKLYKTLNQPITDNTQSTQTNEQREKQDNGRRTEQSRQRQTEQ